MNLQIKATTPRLYQIVDIAVPFFAEELNLLNNRFDLTVYTVKGLIKEHDCRGLCQTEEITKNKRKSISVMIDSRLRFDQIVSVLAHEMIHVKQIVKGQYWYFTDDYDDCTHFWLGKSVEAEYYERPWEKEAWSKEKLLAIKFEQIFYKILQNM